MTDAADPPPLPGKAVRSQGRRALRIVSVLIGGLLIGLLILAALLYINRREAARQILTGWLEQQSIPSDIQVERIELDGLVARVRIGSAVDPDISVERVEVDYALGAPWSKTGLGLTPSRIRLVRPVVRASVRGGKLTLGSLDPLVERFSGRPPSPDSPGPRVLVEGARIRLDTDYGPARIMGDARIDDGRLVRLTARMPAATFRNGDTGALGLQATLDLTTTGERVSVRFAAVAARLDSSGTEVRDADLDLTFDGRVTGGVDAFRVEGISTLDLEAARIEGPGASATTARLRLTATRTELVRDPQGLNWRLDGDTALTADRVAGAGLEGDRLSLISSQLTAGGRDAAVQVAGPVTLAATRLVWNDLTLNEVRGQIRARTEFDLVSDEGLRVTATGGFRSPRTSWPLFGAPGGDDLPELAGMKQALSAFALDVPAFQLATGSSGTRLTLTRPASLRPDNGGVLTLSPATTPIFAAPRGQAGGGALFVTATRGQGLPEAAFTIPVWQLTPSGFSATLDGRAALDFGLARGITLQTQGQLVSSAGRLTFVAADCSALTVERLDLGENDVVEVAGDICPVDRPLLGVANGHWQAEGAIRGFVAAAPFLALDVRDAEGRFAANGGPAGLGLEARVTRATIEDATTPLRFNPMGAAGSVRLSGEDWTGAFDLARGGAVLGRLDLTHDGVTGAGGLTIKAPSIVFAKGGLQPADLSPLAEFVGTPASGSVAFDGRIDWQADSEGTSSGRLTLSGLDFTSPAGPVTGLRGTIDFVNLAPLTAAPGQRLFADRLESVAPLTDLVLTFGLDKAAVTIEGGDLMVAGGRIRVEPFAVSLDPDQPIRGVIVLENVQLGQVIAGAGFGDKVNLDAVVSGRLPFSSDRTNGVRISGGSLAAVQPGRLSIARAALSGLEADGGGEAVPPGTVQDLAYQAMENLSFDILSAELNSLDAGRIGVLFRIRGRHDPPEFQDLRIPMSEFISREFLNRPLPLPSGTGIDLTLDTTLNLNQLIGDLLELNRARDGRPTPTPTAPPVLP